jgi:hypothetical protein
LYNVTYDQSVHGQCGGYLSVGTFSRETDRVRDNITEDGAENNDTRKDLKTVHVCTTTTHHKTIRQQGVVAVAAGPIVL